jgi:hypothetical protein
VTMVLKIKSLMPVKVIDALLGGGRNKHIDKGALADAKGDHFSLMRVFLFLCVDWIN